MKFVIFEQGPTAYQNGYEAVSAYRHHFCCRKKKTAFSAIFWMLEGNGE
jgi:hypothetical protein